MYVDKKPLLKALLVFIIYVSYISIFSGILDILNIENNILGMFLSDALFLIGIAFYYKNKIKDSFEKFFKKRTIIKNFFFVLKWVLILFAITLVEGVIYEVIFPNYVIDDNTKIVYSMADMSTCYTVFKTMIFAVIAEELVFKQTIRETIKNNSVYIVVSGLLYSIMNVAYSNFSITTIVDFIQCFIFFNVLSYVYIKEEDNIISIMVIKFCYNLIPLSILLLGMGV